MRAVVVHESIYGKTRAIAEAIAEGLGADVAVLNVAEVDAGALLSDLVGDGFSAAAFDTRLDRSPAVTGAAARGIAKRLQRRGCKLIAEPESFFVVESEGPLEDGEAARARAWGAALAEAPG